jgi:hypothetical protein
MQAQSQITKRIGILLFWAIAAFVGSSASACPICDSATGVQVRASLLNEDFGTNLLATVLPFVVVLGLLAVIDYCGRPRRSYLDADKES